MGNGSGWNLWVWLVGVVVRRYIDFLIIATCPYSFVSTLFGSIIPTFYSFCKKVFSSCFLCIFQVRKLNVPKNVNVH